jgi:sulfatase maturation enzyme AslB (radical SAM superfamily)
MRIKTVIDLALKNLEYAYYKVTNQLERIVPYKVVVELTTQCNSKCLYCDIWKIEKEHQQKISLSHFELFLKTMDKHLLWLALTGGEVASFNQFPEVVRLIKLYSPNLRILTFTTNGLLPQRILDFALLMKQEVNCDIFITISLDGDEETHDTIRGIKGNYEKCMETYRLLKAHNIPCHFGITVAEGNYAFIKKSFKEYRDKIKAVTFVHTGGIFLTQAVDNRATDAKIKESLEEIYKHYRIDSLGEVLIKMYLKLGVLFMQKERQTNIIPCDVGLSSAHLMANGDLHPCMYLPPIKTMADGFALSDFHNAEAQKMLADVKRDKCPHCWMSCYGPHSMLQSPVQSLSALLKPIK